jgi:anti-sigma factor RsiW
MTDRDDRLLRLNAALDGELDPMDSLKFEREMRDDPVFAAEYQRLATLRDAVRRHAPREAAPRALADRIAAMAGSAPLSEPAVAKSTIVPFQRRAWFDRRALALAASLAILGFAVGAGLTSLRPPSRSAEIAQNLVSDFARSQIAGQPFDVASSDRHTVKPWLAAHATISAEIADLTQAGFTLEGGRIAVVNRVPAPTLVYRKREHLIAVTELPPAMASSRGAAIETIDGFHVARWSDANLAYVAVSDIDEQELAAFVEAFRQAAKPAAEGTGR